MDIPTVLLIADMLQKLLNDRVNAILLLPKGVKTWTPLLNQLPVVATHSLSGRKGMFSFGAQVSPSLSLVMNRTHMKAFLVVFPRA